jgi:hypothetical protein
MRDLLDNQFLAHFFPHQRPANAEIIHFRTNVGYFELEDDDHVLYLNQDEGTAVYQNNGGHTIGILNMILSLNHYHILLDKGEENAIL